VLTPSDPERRIVDNRTLKGINKEERRMVKVKERYNRNEEVREKEEE
jgi:hypothetical protein